MPDEDVSVQDQDNTMEESGEEQSLQDKLKDAISVKVEDIGPLRKKLTITIPRDSIDEQLNEQYDELRQEAVVPGFRRGRAPQKLLEKRFGSDVGEQVGSSLIGNAYFAAVEKESLDVLGDPMVQVTVKEKVKKDGKTEEIETEKLLPVDQAMEHLDLPTEGDFTYACELEIKPEFELPNLEKIPVEKPVLTVGDEDVDNEVKRMQTLRGQFKPVEGGKIEEHDLIGGTATITVDGNVLKTEERAELAARDQRYDGLLLEGFGKAAIGKKIGDTISVEVTIPDDYEVVDARAKSGTFTIEAAEHKRLEVPEIDEEFVTSMGFDSVDEYRGFIKEQMERQIEQEARRVMHDNVSKYLLDNVQMELPEGLSQRQAENIVSRQMMDLYSRGLSEADISKQVDEMRTEAAAQAADGLRLYFVMDKIAEDKEVTVNEEEINAAIAEIAHRRNLRFDRVRDEIIGTNHLNTLYIRLRDQKILEMLLADADVTEKDVSAETKEEKKGKGGAKKKAKKKADDK